MTAKSRIGIVGVSGYGGGELARLLAGHPHAEIAYVTSGTYEGKPLSAALPGVAGRVNLTCERFDVQAAVDRCDIVFLAGEAGLAMETAPKLLAAGKKIVDLSADFRLKDPAEYKVWYKREHTAVSWLDHAVYGLPELYRNQIKTANLIANPGCYVTAATLSLAPLLADKRIDPKSIIVDGHSGVSGAGRSKFGLDYHFSEVNESIKPYSVAGTHRHTPEIEQNLSDVAGQPILVTFTPHLAPITRGILSTSYATLTGDAAGLTDLFKEYYADKPFVVVLDPGQYPATKWTEGTNYCYIGVGTDDRTGRVLVIAALDNLVKGAAGQAIQNMNLMNGWDETAGLMMPAVWP